VEPTVEGRRKQRRSEEWKEAGGGGKGGKVEGEGVRCGREEGGF